MPRPQPLWRFGSFVLLTAAALAACGHSEPPPDAAADAPPPTVIVQRVEPTSVPVTQEFVGTTASVQDVNVLARVKGTLERVYFKEGTLVKAGQLLFSLQKDKYQADVQAAQASVLKAKAQLYEAQQTVPVLQAEAVVAQNKAKVGREQLSVDRVVPLGKVHAVPQSDVDNATQNLLVAQADLAASIANLETTKVQQTANIESAQAALLSAQADLANAQLNLSYCTITSPVTGIIGFLKYDVGNVVGDADSQVLDTVSTVDPIKVLFAADENTYLALADRAELYEGRPLRDQPVPLLLGNGKTFGYSGTLYTVARALDTKTGTITVEARFPNPGGYLRPGQFGRVSLVTADLHNAIVIPQIAVVQTQGANNAYVVDNSNMVEQRSLTLGTIYKDGYVVTAGLKPGDRVIVQGVQKATPGKKVQIAAATSK